MILHHLGREQDLTRIPYRILDSNSIRVRTGKIACVLQSSDTREQSKEVMIA